MKKKILLLTILILLSFNLKAQSLTQLGYIIKQAMPSTTSVAILVTIVDRPKLINESRKAKLITRMDYFLYEVAKSSDIISQINKIYRLKNPVVIVLANDDLLNQDAVKYISTKLYKNKIPLISNRSQDTLQGAILAVFKNNDKLEKHLNKIIAAAYGITLPESFVSGCIVDAE